MKHLLLALGLLCLFPAVLHADDLPRVKATEEKAIRELLGKKATVTGRVIVTKETKTGMNFLDFEGGKFTVVSWKEDNAKFEGGSPAKLYAQKVIEVTGTIIEYRSKSAKADDPGKLEIKLTSPDQVKIAKESVPAADADGKEAKKPAGAGKPAESKKDPASKAGAEKEPPAEKAATPPADTQPGRVDSKKFFK